MHTMRIVQSNVFTAWLDNVKDERAAARIVARIRANGPITIADYMAACLGDPDYGYYMRREPFGRGGDFVTAPEVSQIFGELIGAWCLATWEAMGSPVDTSTAVT